ncbi:uncharacterized protein LOC127277220 isoform X1 [Leptopilina boulardi]|uniref:uncharacterized protein LOC127277220 isoform X1 n=1 Tax=Leptopilina boulardi TaxID=63433 RepID=UPI0021F53EF5|nr:uncharacterized protein LOC127277220 isoform X1 [Leptopilina boulardi]XP_051154095.1 uncharacterized protein LOC127277220 isoform X1 [Leptopilina boulardi]
MDHETRNGTGNNDGDEECIIHFIIGNRKEIASFRPDQVTNKEIKDLFRNAAEAGPLDIVKLRKGEKILNISPQLPANTSEDPYILQVTMQDVSSSTTFKVVGAHPSTSGMIDIDVCSLERRVSALEQEHREAASSRACITLSELQAQVNAIKQKLETIEHLSWLGFHKQLPEPISSEACRRLQYRRKSDSVKRKVREKFFNMCDVALSTNVREWLKSSSFDAQQWEDEELLLMLQTMFVELEILEKFNISLTTLRNFLYEVYNNYNEVPFHNFRHCFCVAQMMYAIAWTVDLPSKIGHLEVLILIVSCICHDLDHPGYNNIYQINARTELALRYNDISPLENHHCSVAFRVLEALECNILASLDPTTYRTVREGIIRCILATDMARHNEILGQFTDVIPEFDYTNKAHINLLSMILIKVSDISNEARPIEVADPWLDSLLQEFFKQSDAEKLEGLPVTPFMDRDKVTKPSSQCSFIGFVLLPLFEALGELFPELQDLIVSPVRYALEYYRRLNEAAKDERLHRKSVVDLGEHVPSATSGGNSSCSSVVKSTSSHSVRSKRSGGTIHSRSRSTDEDGMENLTIEEADNLESSDPETATEVEISEKTLKFKISTEGSISASSVGRKSCPGSRKGSREKSSLDYHNHEFAKAMREHDRRRSKGENLSSDMSSPISVKSGEDSRILEEFEKDETLLIESISPKSEGNGNVTTENFPQKNNVNKRSISISGDSDIGTNHKEVIKDIRCCRCDDKSNSNNQRSLMAKLRNLTDRLSISFDTKEPPILKPVKHATKSLNKSNSLSSGSSSTMRCNVVCKKCNLTKAIKEGRETIVDLSTGDKKSMTFPKARKYQDCRSKSWKTVFAKEKRPSISLEILPASNIESTIPKHRRNLSNPEGKIGHIKSQSPNKETNRNFRDFKEIDVRPKKPEIHVDQINPGSSSAVDQELGNVEIRRSSASMEDISKITKQNEAGILNLLEKKNIEDQQQHTGSLDSMLCKESITTCVKKPTAFSSPASTKKSSPGLFSRFKSGMSIDGTRSSSNSGSLHDQPSQQSGWISSLTASFRPKRHINEPTTSSHPTLSPSNE